MESEKVNKLDQATNEHLQNQQIYEEISDEDLNQAFKRSDEAHARLSKQWDVLNARLHQYLADEGQKRLDELLSIQAKYQDDIETLNQTLTIKRERKEELQQIILDRENTNRQIYGQIEDSKQVLSVKEDKIAFNDEYEKAVLSAREKKDLEFDNRALELDERERELRDRDFCLRDKVETLQQRKEAFQVRIKERREKLAETRAALEGETNKRIINWKELFSCKRRNRLGENDKSQHSLPTTIEPTLDTTSEDSQSNQLERIQLSKRSKISGFMSRFRRRSQVIQDATEPSANSTPETGFSESSTKTPAIENVVQIKSARRRLLVSKLKSKLRNLSGHEQNGSNPTEM